MTIKSKKIFLALSVVVPFLAYCLYYYGMMVSNAPYKFNEFKYMVFEYGFGDSLLNKYNSKTQDYQYLNTRDSVVHKKLKLTKDDLLYLHRKAADLGFWNFPAQQVNNGTGKLNPKVPHYKIEFHYSRKTKAVLYAADYIGNETLKDANERLIKEIQRILTDAEARGKK
ncbi:hypothetical protein DJ568_04130 [Mucilaginibacter hurinus]|uniref:Uncharacterized protein n=1 Tax=Mucilaginibacter hurinus TaxID=2201324 RepID=A0A367GS69_9SPHI|nr:hypothetical protein [Mucilaginibacter hurinus]RCH55948.1 hypothetical protein DJ568_04130 [Mucilaginibacter hurinus]